MFEITWEKLLSFCSKDKGRSALLVPFIHGEFIYATDGHLTIFVKRDTVKIPEGFKNDPWWDDNYEKRAGMIVKESHKESEKWVTVKNFPNEMSGVEECEKCGGSGIYDCMNCGHEGECAECDGSGEMEIIQYFRISGIIFRGFLLERIRNFPHLQFGIFSDDTLKAHRYKFDGGGGCIMPCRVLQDGKNNGEELEILNDE